MEANTSQRTPCEIYSRVVGYLRPVKQWNEGKQSEFADRQTLTNKFVILAENNFSFLNKKFFSAFSSSSGEEFFNHLRMYKSITNIQIKQFPNRLWNTSCEGCTRLILDIGI